MPWYSTQCIWVGGSDCMPCMWNPQKITIWQETVCHYLIIYQTIQINITNMDQLIFFKLKILCNFYYLWLQNCDSNEVFRRAGQSRDKVYSLDRKSPMSHPAGTQPAVKALCSVCSSQLPVSSTFTLACLSKSTWMSWKTYKRKEGKLNWSPCAWQKSYTISFQSSGNL